MTEPKFVQGHIGITPLWVFPHEGEFNGDTLIGASIVDEMSLQYQPGVSMADARAALARALRDVYDYEEAEAAENAKRLKGAWIVPNYIWTMVGAAICVEMGSDSTQYAVNEAIQRMLASQSLFHIGESNPEDV